MTESDNSSSGTDRDWNILTVRKQPFGPMYSVDVMDGDDYAVDIVHVAGVRVGISQEMELECQSFDIVRDESSGGHLALSVEPADRTQDTDTERSEKQS